MTRLGWRNSLPSGDAPYTSLPQQTAEGVPLALARRAAEGMRLANAATALEEQGLVVTSRALAETARISREYRLCVAPHTPGRHDGITVAVINNAIECLLHC